LFRYSTKRTAAELDYVEKITAQHKDFLYAKEVDGVGVGLFTKKRIPAASLVFHDMPYLLAPDIDSSKVISNNFRIFSVISDFICKARGIVLALRYSLV